MPHSHPPVHLYFLRHGEVEDRYHRAFGGSIDMDLSPRGHEQARALADYLRRVEFDAIYASPMKRVRQTFSPLAARTGLTPVILAGLREVHFGDWQGLTWEQVHARFGISAFEWLDQLEAGAVPNGETGEQFRARVQPCLRQILAECEGQSVAVVCHGGVIRMMLAILLELPLPTTASFEVDYASITRVDYRPRRSEVQVLNLTPWRDLP